MPVINVLFLSFKSTLPDLSDAWAGLQVTLASASVLGSAHRGRWRELTKLHGERGSFLLVSITVVWLVLPALHFYLPTFQWQLDRLQFSKTGTSLMITTPETSVTTSKAEDEAP